MYIYICVYIALHANPIINCYWVGAVPRRFQEVKGNLVVGH